jgi:hypothetical protein
VISDVPVVVLGQCKAGMLNLYCSPVQNIHRVTRNILGPFVSGKLTSTIAKKIICIISFWGHAVT